jgi:hypothetical protein
LERVHLVMGDTGRTVNMGGASAATGVSRADMNLREMAAESRRLMIGMAAKTLGVAAERNGMPCARHSSAYPRMSGSAAAFAENSQSGPPWNARPNTGNPNCWPVPMGAPRSRWCRSRSTRWAISPEFQAEPGLLCCSVAANLFGR